jgi:hypothetical protein
MDQPELEIIDGWLDGDLGFSLVALPDSNAAPS